MKEFIPSFTALLVGNSVSTGFSDVLILIPLSFTSFPVVPQKVTILSVVLEAGPTTSPVPAYPPNTEAL